MAWHGSGGCLLVDPAVTVADLAALAGALGDLGLRAAVGVVDAPALGSRLWSAELGDPPRYAAPAAVTIAETERDGMVEASRSRPQVMISR